MRPNLLACVLTLYARVLRLFTDSLSALMTFKILALHEQVFSSEVGKLKWLSFDLVLKLGLYSTLKTKKHSQYGVLPTRPSHDGNYHWN